MPLFLFYGGTVVSIIAIIRAIRQARIADKWLRLANHLGWLVVVGMVLMLAGVGLWGIALALVTSSWVAMNSPWLPLTFGMFLAVMVALWASIFRMQPPASQPRSHDASPSGGDSPGEMRGAGANFAFHASQAHSAARSAPQDRACASFSQGTQKYQRSFYGFFPLKRCGQQRSTT